MSNATTRRDRIFGIVPRNWATPLTASVFAVIGVSGLMLFFGLFEDSVKEMHEWIGLAFVAVVILHLAKNWMPLQVMLKQKATKASALAVALVAAVFIGGALMGGEEENPLRVMARAVETAPLEASAAVLGISRDEVFARLRKAGIEPVADARSLAEIIKKSGVDSRRVIGAVVAPAQE